jgi:shikimate kinase
MIQKGKITLPNLYLIGFMGTGKSSVGKICPEN